MLLNVESFVFLGSVVATRYRNTGEDVLRRIALASTSFGRLQRSVWSRRDVSLRLKIRLLNCLIKPIAIYASETWTLREEEWRTRGSYWYSRCYVGNLGVMRQDGDQLRNVEIRERLSSSEHIVETIKKRRLRYDIFG